jgi:hypothetical protein
MHIFIAKKILTNATENIWGMEGKEKLCIDNLWSCWIGGKVLYARSYGVEHLASIRVAYFPVD